MEGMNAPRTEAQRAASAANGSKSKGPTTEEGRASSSMNRVSHGLTATSVLLPSERPADYQANLESWVETLKPGSPGELDCVTRVADLSFRLRRLQRLEDRHLLASIESALSKSEPTKLLNVGRNAALGLTVMISTAGEVTDACTGQRLALLLPPIRQVLAMVEALSLPAGVTVPMDTAFNELEAMADADLIPVAYFQGLVVAAERLKVALDSKVAELNVAIDSERTRIADELLVGDDRELRRFDRHRQALGRAMDSELGRLRLVRELAQPGSGSFGAPVQVELRLVGRGPNNAVPRGAEP